MTPATASVAAPATAPAAADLDAYVAWNAAGPNRRQFAAERTFQPRAKTLRPDEVARRERVAARKAALDPMVAPEDYVQLFTQYYDYVINLVVKLGICSRDSEDRASDVLLRFYERGFLEKFDPDYVIEYDGRRYPARFQSFLSTFVERYCRRYRDQQKRRGRHEVLLCDMPLPDGRTWVAAYGPGYEQHEEVEGRDMVAAIRRFVHGLPVRGRRDPGRLIDLIIEQVFGAGLTYPDRTALAAEFGCSESTVGVLLRELRAQLAEARAAGELTLV